MIIPILINSATDMKISILKIAITCILFAGGVMLVAPKIIWIHASAIVVMLIGGACLLWSVIEKYRTAQDLPGLVFNVAIACFILSGGIRTLNPDDFNLKIIAMVVLLFGGILMLWSFYERYWKK